MSVESWQHFSTPGVQRHPSAAGSSAALQASFHHGIPATRCPAGSQKANDGKYSGTLAENQNSKRSPMRKARARSWSPVEDPFTPPTPLMTPTLASWLMFVTGLEKFGWLKKLVPVASHRSRTRSVIGNVLYNPTCHTFTPGPLMTPLADVPNRPSGQVGCRSPQQW